MILQYNDYEKAVFTITVADVQLESLRLIGRELTDEELDLTIDGLEWGLLTDIDTVYKAAIDEAVRINREP